MKSLKLEVVSLEDRSVPAALSTRPPASPPPSEAAVVAAASPPTLAGTAATSKSHPLGKLAANHNLTLIRDRRGREPRRR